MSTELYQTISIHRRWLITAVVMAAALLQVIDTTIVNVALPHMQGSLSASSDEITWTLTSYMVASAIFMPLTGYLADRFGRKNYLFMSVLGFTVFSGLCGASTNLIEMVIFRLLQGIFGAALVPLSQAILTDIFPPEERGKAMAIWGMGIMVGPILGPTLGGYLTDIASWRWTFYVNLPVGIATLLLMNVVPDSARKTRHMDWVGLGLLTLAIGGLQFVLDRGNMDDWFNASSIQFATYFSAVGFLGFILYQISNTKTGIFDLAIFKDRNFTLSSIMLCCMGIAIYGTSVLQPLMMENLLNYPVLTTGLIIAPRGISSMISMMIISKITNRVDARWMILSGSFISFYGVWVCTQYSTNINMFWLTWPMLLQGFGIGMIMVPLSTTAFSTLPAHLRTDAAGVFSLLRTIGGSIGISITITLFSRREQLFWNGLGGGITMFNPAVAHYLQPLHVSPTSPLGGAVLSLVLEQQAAMLAYVNAFAFNAWMFLLIIPIAIFLKKSLHAKPH
jgi:DHA2 family multidrug resistance protein